MLLILLAGCAGAGKTVQTDTETGLPVEVSATTGGIRGIVVDAAIAPIAKATVSLTTPTGVRNTTTDAQGRFAYGGLAAGTYFLLVSHLLYKTLQSSVEVQVGTAPPVTRIQMEPVFTKTPYHEINKWKGYIACGHQDAVSAPCIVDYSTLLCNGGCVPQAHDQINSLEGDIRFFSGAVNADWQTMIVEDVFGPPNVGTSHGMRLSISYHDRTASEFYADTNGPSPLQLRLESGEKHPSESGSKRTMVNASGDPDVLIFTNIAADDGQPGAFAFQQEFQIFLANFYNAKPPEGWSFARGDEFPF
jgi:hypothetical protein